MKESNKRIAHCIPHTHWDPFWYFTAQDSMVVFAYNMKEMLLAFEKGEIQHFFLDGQTVAIDEYLEIHPEDRHRVEKLVKEKKLIIGPFNSQLDCFISCGESVINNLKIGIENGDALGGSGKIAYLADPFGQTYDFPKIFQQMGIHEFVFTRGINDAYQLGIDFYFTSNDGSKVLAHSLLSGYGYGAYAFKEGTLFTEDAMDYNRINVGMLIDRLVERSVLKNEFVFPLGFDQNPIIRGIPEKIKEYNEKFENYHFKQTTWEDYFKHVRECGKDIKTWNKEILGAQYHRIHISGMNSCRSDIKTIQDQAERVLTFESQPLMAMMDVLKVPYDHDIVKKAWYTLVNCQTHASATHIDETNSYIKNNSKEARSMAIAMKVYLMRLCAASILPIENKKPLVVFHTLPWTQRMIEKLTIITRKKQFKLWFHDKELKYTLVERKKENAGVVRKDPSLMNPEECFYKTTVMVDLKEFKGIGYDTIYVEETEDKISHTFSTHTNESFIEDENYRIELHGEGISITDKKRNVIFKKGIYLEDGGDVGDTYDYDYPDSSSEWILYHHFDEAVANCIKDEYHQKMTIQGSFLVPADQEERKLKKRSSILNYEISFTLSGKKPQIQVKGVINNQAKDHRLRIVMATGLKNEMSYAGTQFGYVKRDTYPKELDTWKQDGFFEEPSTTKPLLNHVSAVGNNRVYSVFTRSLKEYDFIHEGYEDIAITIFRACGWLGLPDLNRRPGRPSGLANKVFETPDAQMLGEITFELGIATYSSYNGNIVMNDYVKYACDSMYYQHQDIDKTVFPISYFPINPLSKALPDHFEMFSLDNEASFGTLTKAKQEDAYIVRTYNSEYYEIEGGSIHSNKAMEIYHCDLLENKKEQWQKDLPKYRQGELRNIMMFRKD
ncbi:glycoside hydrolase family 38 N-terminal domain-containing protein [Amedibacillus sp. YH-ame10]